MTAPSSSDLKQRLSLAIDNEASSIIKVAQIFWTHPEAGFREEWTAAHLAQAFRTWGLRPTEGMAITGVRADIDFGRPGPTVAVLGELDALPVPDHPQADPQTGVAHACGHHAQLAYLVGVAAAFRGANVEGELAGRVALMAIPAEEGVQQDWRQQLVADGRIEFSSGKREFIRLGMFDDVDMALLVHATSAPGDRRLSIPEGNNGYVSKRATFHGRAAHAALAPHEGINALSAATLALNGIAMQRETFRETDVVRVHSIVTAGGTAVNVMPETARLETLVRARSLEAIEDAAVKVDRSYRAGALAMGAALDIETMPGYLPLIQDHGLASLFRANSVRLVGADGWADTGHVPASTDAGDLSHLVPLLQAQAGGFSGSLHGADFHAVDNSLAYVDPVKAIILTVVDLLADDAELGRKVVETAKPRLSRAEYLHLVRASFRTDHFNES